MLWNQINCIKSVRIQLEIRAFLAHIEIDVDLVGIFGSRSLSGLGSRTHTGINNDMNPVVRLRDFGTINTNCLKRRQTSRETLPTAPAGHG